MNSLGVFFPRVEAIDEVNWIIRFGDQISEECSLRVQRGRDLIGEHLDDHLLDLVPSYTTLLLTLAKPAEDNKAFHAILLNLAQDALLSTPDSASGKDVVIPVYYGREVALDWSEVEQQTGLAFGTLIELHQQQSFRVYAIGFAPGFAYLGTTPSEMRVSRKASPRLKVPAGSVALADNQTAVYPSASPGGWQIIGRSPMELVNWNLEPPMPMSVGDRVRFEAVTREQYLKLGGVFDAT